MVAEDGIAYVIEMWHLRLVEQDAVLEFAGVPHHHAIARDHILAHVTSGADVTVFADPSRSFEDRALFDNCSAPDEDVIADERFSDELAENAGLQSKLEIARDLFECVPDILLVLK